MQLSTIMLHQKSWTIFTIIEKEIITNSIFQNLQTVKILVCQLSLLNADGKLFVLGSMSGFYQNVKRSLLTRWCKFWDKVPMSRDCSDIEGLYYQNDIIKELYYQHDIESMHAIEKRSHHFRKVWNRDYCIG